MAILSSTSYTPGYPPNKINLSLFESPKALCIDNLELLDWILGHETVYSLMKSRVNQKLPTLVSINSSYMSEKAYEKYTSLASIIGVINSYEKSRGVVKCIHIRGYTKNTQENTDFEVIGHEIVESKTHAKLSKPAPKTTFRLDVSEEEKKMREMTPLPYEKTDRLIQIDDEDYISPDEEGDEDDYYQ
jgi:hypothetical protein